MQKDPKQSPTTKTLQVRGCKDETFHLEGCTDSGGVAEACIRDGSPAGVRVLKSSRNVIVGYGSCCSESDLDKISQTTTVICSVPHAPAKANTAPPVTAKANTAISSQEANSNNTVS